MTFMNYNCKALVTKLVESHDLIGLKNVIDDPNITCFTYPCNFQPGLKKHMKEYLKEGISVVEQACQLGHLDIVELFLNNGCSANLPTSHGRLIHTVLISLKSKRYLIDNGSALKIIELLMAMDCDVNVKSYKGKSPLMLASEIADPGIMRELLRHCLDWQLSCPNKDNWHTPLHMVCMNGSVACLCLLLARLQPGDIHTEDIKKYTPLSCSLTVLKNNLVFHSNQEAMDRALLGVQYSHIAIVELIVQASRVPLKPSKKSQFPQTHAKLSAVHLALETANEFERLIEFNCLKLRAEPPADQSPCQTQHRNSLHERKLLSPYAELVRMLICYTNISLFHSEELNSWKKKYYYISSLLTEIEDYIQQQWALEQSPPSLMGQARQVIRAHVARFDHLSLMGLLPLPRKLRDYVQFVDF